MSNRERYIRNRAAQLGLDPDAVVAIASVEGQRALHGGVSVGDHGTSFGPFQLHVGGALPKGKGSAWAHSNAGIDYALRQMAGVAGGLHGKAAVSAISSRFERPADVQGEINKAMGYYGHVGAPGGTPDARTAGSPSGVVDGLSSSAFKSMATAQLLQQAQNTISGRPQDASGLMSLAIARKQMQDQTQAGAMAAGVKVEGQPASATGQHAVNLAHEYLGVKYTWGGEDPKNGFDCSGLLQYVWGKEGVQIPRTSYDQWRTGRVVGKQQLRPGDAVFFKGSDAKGNLPGHVGMYIGHGQFIEAPHTGATVRISNLASRADFVGGRRFK